jgi:hypothetical protein
MADSLTRALQGLRRDGSRAQRSGDRGLLIAIGLADEEKRPGGDVDVDAGDSEDRGENDNLGAQRAHEANAHECPLCGGAHDEDVHADDEE